MLLTIALCAIIIVLSVLLLKKTAAFKNVETAKLLPGDELSLIPNWPLDKTNYFGIERFKKYGDMYYIWHWYRPILVIANAAAVKEFYSDHYNHKRERNFTCCGTIFERLMGDALAVVWGKQRFLFVRNLYQKFFTEATAESFMPLIYQETQEWLKSCKTKEGVSEIPLRVLAKALYGRDIPDSMIQKLKYFVKLHNEVFGYTHLPESKLYFYGKLPTLPNKRLKQFTNEWRDFHLELYQNYKKNYKLEEREDLFSKLADQVYSNAIEHTATEFHQTLGEIILANTDLTYAALGWSVVHCAQYPEVQSTLAREIYNTSRDEPITSLSKLNEIKYAFMVMNESARLRPALNLAMPEKTVRDVTIMNGYLIPKDTTVIVDCYSLNRNPEYWKDADTFNPLRWESGKEEVPYSYHRFGLGPRKCMGNRWGNAINGTILVSIIRKFSVQLADPQQVDVIKTEGIPFFTCYMPGKIILTPRD